MNSENTEEIKYLELLKNIIQNGIQKSDRTQIGTYSIFGQQSRYNLTYFPLFTTKKLRLKSIFYELMWILSGSTDNNILKEKKVKIWNGNSSRDFLDSRGLQHYVEGDIGPTYGFAMRNFGFHNDYKGCKKKYIGKGGFDQLEHAIHLIKTNPTSRRIIISLWDPNVNDMVALMPCMMTYNFYVDTKNKKLNLSMYIRSSDTLLGYPWNVAYSSLLVYMICNLEGVNLTPGELLISTCDQHIYKNHLPVVQKLIKRKPYPFPKLIVKRKVKKITDYKLVDFLLVNYQSHPYIKARMAI